VPRASCTVHHHASGPESDSCSNNDLVVPSQVPGASVTLEVAAQPGASDWAAKLGQLEEASGSRTPDAAAAAALLVPD
jgi:hypothetical protein